MKPSPVLGTVFAALGEYLDALSPLAEVNVDLAILPVNLLLDAHAPAAHVEAVLDAPALAPERPPDLCTQHGLQVAQDSAPATVGSRAACAVQDGQGRAEVVQDLHDAGQDGVVVAEDGGLVELDGPVVF